jgi:hypothetical protein
VGAKNTHGIMEVVEISPEETTTIVEFACEPAHSAVKPADPSVDLPGICDGDRLSRFVIKLPQHKDVYTQLV